MQRLILANPRERTAEFRRTLLNDLKDKVVAEEHVVPEGDLLDKLEAIRERAEHEREKELLDKIRERGVSGLDEKIAALWDLEAEIRWCDNVQLAIRDAPRKECPFCGRKPRARSLVDVLVDLAAARGARLDFVLGENENSDTRRNEFGGIAGVTRF